MPVLLVKTNIASPATKKEILQTLSQMTATILSKPESYVMAMIEYEQTLIFAGSDAPAAYVELKSLGLPENKTEDFSRVICENLQHLLGIDPSRIYIDFASPQRHLFGWNKATF